jgi:hypothetical protein
VPPSPRWSAAFATSLIFQRSQTIRPPNLPVNIFIQPFYYFISKMSKEPVIGKRPRADSVLGSRMEET